MRTRAVRPTVAWLICGAGRRSAHSLFVYLQLQQSAPETYIKEGRIALRHPGKVADYAVPAVPIASDAMGGLEQRPFVLGRYHVPGAVWDFPSIRGPKVGKPDPHARSIQAPPLCGALLLVEWSGANWLSLATTFVGASSRHQRMH